ARADPAVRMLLVPLREVHRQRRRRLLAADAAMAAEAVQAVAKREVHPVTIRARRLIIESLVPRLRLIPAAASSCAGALRGTPACWCRRRSLRFSAMSR